MINYANLSTIADGWPRTKDCIWSELVKDGQIIGYNPSRFIIKQKPLEIRFRGASMIASVLPGLKYLQSRGMFFK